MKLIGRNKLAGFFLMFSGKLKPYIIDFSLGLGNEKNTLFIPQFRCVDLTLADKFLYNHNQIPPEAVSDAKEVNSRSDVYGLGLVVQEVASLLDNSQLRSLAVKMREEEVEARPQWKDIIDVIDLERRGTANT